MSKKQRNGPLRVVEARKKQCLRDKGFLMAFQSVNDATRNGLPLLYISFSM